MNNKHLYFIDYLDEVGFAFVRQCIEAIESRGLDDEGLYRLVGVSSKVNKLNQMALGMLIYYIIMIETFVLFVFNNCLL